MIEKLTIFLTALSLLAASCHSEPHADNSTQPTELQTIEGGDAEVSSPKSLCELVEYADVVGHYHVDRIVSNMGRNLDDPDDTSPAPYTVVSLDGPSWIGPADPEIKMAGGVLPDGRGTIATDLPFTVGQEVIAFLGAPHYDDGTRKPLIQSVLYPTESGGFASDVLMGRLSDV